MRPHPIWILVLVVATAMAAWMPPAKAQSTSVEELERRLQKAKEEKARRDAASARAREDTEVERRKREAEAARAESERKVQEARMATLVVQADAPCTLFLNGKETAQLRKGITEVKVSPGQKLVSCASSEEKLAFEGELDARSGQDTVLRITLAAKVADVRTTRASVLEREAQARREAEARARADAAQAEQERTARERRQREDAERVARQQNAIGEMTKRLKEASPSVLFDTKLSLHWTRSDNGLGLTWLQAQAHCRSLGADWSLPTVDQLKSLHDPELPGIACDRWSCKISSEFKLGNNLVWSSEHADASGVWVVALDRSERVSFPPNSRFNLGGALCVRRS